MSKIVTQDSKGHVKLASEKFPLPVTVKDSVPFHFSGDTKIYTVELDPCMWRRALNAIDSNNSAAGWTSTSASLTALTMPANYCLYLSPDGASYRFGAWNSTTAHPSVNRNLFETHASNAEVPTVFQRFRQIRIKTNEEVPMNFTIVSQSNFGGQNSLDAQGQLAVVFVGAAYPNASNEPDMNTARWIAMPIGQGNFVQFGRVNAPGAVNDPPVFRGIASGRPVGAVVYTFPFPIVTPFPFNPNAPWYFYLVNLGYYNTRDVAVYHPFVSLSVETEVLRP